MADRRRVLYLDCFSGISGDMFLGALLDCGASEEAIRAGLALLPIGREYEMTVEKTSRSGVGGTSVQVRLIDHHTHHHGHSHDHQSYSEICKLIANSSLSENVRRRSLEVFRVIGEAEAAVHGVELQDVHFHEIGAVDSIVDIVGAMLALESMPVDEIICSRISDGSGTISCQHGVLPVPVPAVVKMLEGTNIPLQAGTSDTELVTPTGLGLVKALCHRFEPLPAMNILRVGYGFGQRSIGRLNALRAMVGEIDVQDLAADQPIDEAYSDRVLVLSCNLDNSTPEQLGVAANALMAAGALDVAFAPLMMKKWRPGQLMEVIAPLELESELVRIIFEQTGTIGIRRRISQRHVMKREICIVSTRLGKLRFKINRWHDLVKAYPEQDDLIQAAKAAGISPEEAERQVSLDFLTAGGVLHQTAD